MRNKVGVATSTYHYFSLEQTVEGISKSGYKYVEPLSVPGFCNHIIPSPEEMDEEGAKKLLGLCKQYNLELYCVGGHMRLMKDDSVDRFKKVIDCADLLGAKFITTDAGDVKGKEDEVKFYSDMEVLGNYARSKDVTICFELHGDWCNKGKETAEVVRKIDNSHVRINYDTGNAIYYGDTRPEEDIKYALPYMSFLHLKDSGGEYKGYDFPVFGEGTVDFDSIFKTIESYDGPMSVELEFDGKEHPIEEVNAGIKKCYDFLKNYGYVE